MPRAQHILAELSEQDVDWILAHGTRRRCERGAALIREGVVPDAVFFVLEGGLSVSASRSGGRSATLSAGDVVGEMSFLDRMPPTATVTALADTVVFVIPREALTTKLALDAGFAARFHRALAVFLTGRLRALRGESPEDEGSAAVPAVTANPHLAQARFERLLVRMTGEGRIVLTGNDLTVEAVVRVAEQRREVSLTPAARARLERSHATVRSLMESAEPVYGLTTGLGALKDFSVRPEDNAEFQRNVLLSHAVGVGPDFDTASVRAIMLARLNGLVRGGAGISPAAFELLLAMLNRGIHPVIPTRGSIGMSDLAQLAHLSLPLIGVGEVELDGRSVPAEAALRRQGLQPVTLDGKDALALCSANSVSVGHGALVLGRCLDLLGCAETAAALSSEAFAAHVDVLMQPIHEARPHSGQLASAERQRALLEGSELWGREAVRGVQDPLSFRCTAQVHGACEDVLAFARRTLEIELNATGDNPMVFVEEGAIVSNGNFHPSGLSIAFDALAVAFAQIASMATHRVLRLMSPGLTRLPAQLAHRPGLHSGMGAVQKTVTALNAEIRFLASPASLDFTPVADSIEDHATMTTLGVSKADRLVDLLQYLIAIELVTAAQAHDLRGRPRLGRGTQAAYDVVRQRVDFMSQDRLLAPDLESVHGMIADRSLLAAVNSVLPLRIGLDV